MKGNFQIILLVIFVVGAVFGVLVFSGAIDIGNSGSKDGSLGTVVLWGTMKPELISTALEDFNRANPSFIVKYVKKEAETFDRELLEALASGVGPDMFFLPDNLAYSYANKIYTIPYASYPVASFKNTFAGAGEVFLTSKGTLAFPIAIDPLVMYYNRTLLDASSIVYPPTYWDDFMSMVPLLTKKDENNKLVQSTVAMGQVSNVENSKEILSTLFMQTGNKIIKEVEGKFLASLDETFSSSINPSYMLSFFTNFSDPQKEIYSWNKSLSNSRDAFSSEKLAFYFGFASELQSLVNKNPNQNFLVAPMPQIKNTNMKVTSARVTGLAVSRFSKNLNTAITAASLMATTDFASKVSTAMAIAPARRDLLASKMSDAYLPAFYSSALFSKSWLDPSPEDTDDIFRIMVEKVLSNNMTTLDSVSDANSKLQLLLAR